LPVPNSNAPTPTRAAPTETNRFTPSWSMGTAGYQAEGRVAVADEAHDRRYLRRIDATGLRQLRVITLNTARPVYW
jgi:hypothetical protein